MNEIILPEIRNIVKDVSTELFHKLTMLPESIRKDGQETGMQVILRVPLDIGNLITFPVEKPSEEEQFLSMKNSIMAELYADTTSHSHEKILEEICSGCITFRLPSGKLLHCSVFGLLNSENTTIAIIVLSRALDIKIIEVTNDIIARGGKLPKEIFQENHYLHKLLNEYRKQ